MKNVPIPVKFVKCEFSQVIFSLIPEGTTQAISANDFIRKVEEGKFELVNWPTSPSQITMAVVTPSILGQSPKVSQPTLSH